MSNNESPAARYRRLARECLEVAHTFPNAERRTVLLQMAQVWQRLSDEYAASNTPYFSRLRASDHPCSSNSRFSPRTTRRNRPPLARFDPLDPQWPLLNLTVARFNCRHTQARPAKARLMVGRPPPRSSIPRAAQLRPTHARKLKPRPCGAFFFWPPQLAASEGVLWCAFQQTLVELCAIHFYHHRQRSCTRRRWLRDRSRSRLRSGATQVDRSQHLGVLSLISRLLPLPPWLAAIECNSIHCNDTISSRCSSVLRWQGRPCRVRR